MEATSRDRAPVRNRNTLIFVLAVVCLDTVGFGIIYPVIPQLVRDLTGAGIDKAASYGGWLTFAYALMQFLFSPLLGKLSDRWGRRPVLLSAILGFGIDCVLLAFASNITWLFLGRIVAGITGASYSVASACIGDISDDDTRSRNFGYINAAYSAGFILGPALGGVLGQFSVQLPFIVAGLLSVANFAFGLFFFPETLAAGRRRKFEWRKADPFTGLRMLNRFPGLVPLLIAMFLIMLSSHSMPSVWAYFTMERYGWDTAMIGYSLAFIGGLSVMVQSFLVGAIARRWGEYGMTAIGVSLSAAGLLLIAMSFTIWLLLPALLLYTIGSVQRAGFQSIASGRVSEDGQGALQGSIASLSALAAIIAPPLMTQLFYRFASQTPGQLYSPGMPYLIAFSLAAISLLILFRFRGGRNRSGAGNGASGNRRGN